MDLWAELVKIYQDLITIFKKGLAINRELMYVIVFHNSLWPVADEAAKLFFSEFYKYYQRPNTTKAKVMQQAQHSLMKNKKLSHPLYWAPFILIGEWH